MDSRTLLLQEVLAHFPALAGMSQENLQRLAAGIVLREAPANAMLFPAGVSCSDFPLLLDGEVKVMRTSPEGRDIVLYRVRPGEACVFSSACVLGGMKSPAEGRSDTPVRLAAIPGDLFEQLLVEDRAFRDFVLALLGSRILELSELVEAIAFQRLDQRLARVLVARGPVVTATHQALADEIGSVREIVSRLLRSFEDKGWVRLGRARIDITDAQSLRAHAEG